MVDSHILLYTRINTTTHYGYALNKVLINVKLICIVEYKYVNIDNFKSRKTRNIRCHLELDISFFVI